uniref:Uncharacterized protein n=1 Tax=viral metagenome TaxID=1070528 RepID=A0A6C0HJX3_9ZZZZ
MKERFAVIVTGQLRSFFRSDVQPQFINFIERMKGKYDTHIFFIINDEHMPNVTFEYGCPHTVVHSYIKSAERSHAMFSDIKKTEAYKRIIEVHNNSGDLQHEIPSVDKNFLNQSLLQVSQIQLGLDKIRECEEHTSTTFDYIMRTRFDAIYPDGFLPYGYSAKHTFSEYYFQHSLSQRSLYENYCKRYNLDPSKYHVQGVSDDGMHRLRVHNYLRNINFGADYFLHRNIPSASELNNTVWMYNDHILFARRDVFMNFNDWVSMFQIDFTDICEKNNIRHTIALEAQIIAFFLSKNIPFVMYLDDSWALTR